MVERWKCVGYCRHCSADQDDSTFSKEWGHFEKSSDGAWVRADSALTRIAELEATLGNVQRALKSDSIEYDDMRAIDDIINDALAGFTNTSACEAK